MRPFKTLSIALIFLLSFHVSADASMRITCDHSSLSTDQKMKFVGLGILVAFILGGLGGLVYWGVESTIHHFDPDDDSDNSTPPKNSTDMDSHKSPFEPKNDDLCALAQYIETLDPSEIEFESIQNTLEEYDFSQEGSERVQYCIKWLLDTEVVSDKHIRGLLLYHEENLIATD